MEQLPKARQGKSIISLRTLRLCEINHLFAKFIPEAMGVRRNDGCTALTLIPNSTHDHPSKDRKMDTPSDKG